MAKGYVSTSDADGNPLTILYIHNRPAREDQFLAQLSVLSQFATAWNRGYPVGSKQQSGIQDLVAL